MTNSADAPAGNGPRERQEWLSRHSEEAPTSASGRHKLSLPGSSVASAHLPEWRERHWTSRILHRVGEIVGHSAAGILAASLIVGWLLVGFASRFASWWHNTLFGVTGSVTFVMVFVIQHTQEHRTLATQRKLDELIRSSERADDTLIAVEEADDEHLQALADLNLSDRALASHHLRDDRVGDNQVSDEIGSGRLRQADTAGDGHSFDRS